MVTLGLPGTLHPQTELERFYDRIMQNYEGCIFVTDGAGNIIYTTAQVQYMLGQEPAWFTGKSVYDLVREGVVDRTATQQVIQDGRPHLHYIISRAGTAMLVLTKPCFSETGELEMIASYVTEEGASTRTARQFQRDKENYRNILQYLSEQDEANTSVVAESRAMGEVLERARRVADTDSTILLSGESGVGKEVLARYIHRHSSRRSQPFIPVNCAAIPAELAEAEFFGYERGAFTGANREGKPGLFEFADQGTLFLDELGELPLPLQSKLLRVLESGGVRRVGGKEERRVDVRVLAATNRDLPRLVGEGRFREDLYYRLNVLPILIPPLRERPEDVEALAVAFLQRHNRHYRQSKVFSPEAIQALRGYRWPGNVRELRNVVERMVVLSPANTLYPDPSLLEPVHTPQVPPAVPGPGGERSLKDRVRDFERACIADAFRRGGRNVAETARALDIPLSTLYQKLRTYGLTEPG